MTQPNHERSSDRSQSSLQQGTPQDAGRPKVLLIVGDGAEVMDTLYPFFRLGESYRVVVAAPQRRRYHLVIHELAEGWDITQERAGYHLESDATFQEVKSEEYVALVLPGGRAPEYLRYDADLMRITKDFFAANKPVASVCHGIEILATADVLRGRKVTTIPKCRFDATVCGAEYVEDPVVRCGNLICAAGRRTCPPGCSSSSR